VLACYLSGKVGLLQDEQLKQKQGIIEPVIAVAFCRFLEVLVW